MTNALAAKALLATLSLGAAGAARADQCAYISKDVADRAKGFVNKGDTIAQMCEPCGETTPKGTKVTAVEVGVPAKGYFELRVNGAGVDLAYVFVKDRTGTWSNLGLLVDCGAKGVSATIPKGP
jgi:hypothetical protein